MTVSYPPHCSFPRHDLAWTPALNLGEGNPLVFLEFHFDLPLEPLKLISLSLMGRSVFSLDSVVRVLPKYCIPQRTAVLERSSVLSIP